MRFNRRLFAVVTAALIAPLAACNAADGDNGSAIDDLTIVIPYDAGGPTDLAARQLADPIGEALDANVTVVNRPGGSGMVGTTEVANAGPREDKILYTAVGPLINGEIADEATYDLDSFVPLRAMIDQPAVYVASTESGITSAEGLDGAYTVGTVGAQTIEALATPVVDAALGGEGTVVPFGGSSSIAEAVLGNQVDIGVLQPTNAQQYVEEGTMVPLFVVQSGGERSDVLPDVPNLDELGFDVTSDDLLTPLTGFVAPADMDEDKVDAIRDALAEAATDQGFLDFAQQNGMTVVTDDAYATTGWFDDLSRKIEIVSP